MAKNDFHFKDSPPSSSSSSPISSYNPSGSSPFDSPSSPDRFGSTGPSHTPSYSAASNGNGVSSDASNGGFSTPPTGYAPASPTPPLPQGSYGALPPLPQGGYSGAPALPQGGYSGSGAPPALPQGGNSSTMAAPIPTSFGNPFLDPSRPPSTPAPVLKFGTLTGQPTMPAPPPPVPTGVAEVCSFSLSLFIFTSFSSKALHSQTLLHCLIANRIHSTQPASLIPLEVVDCLLLILVNLLWLSSQASPREIQAPQRLPCLPLQAGQRLVPLLLLHLWLEA